MAFKPNAKSPPALGGCSESDDLVVHCRCGLWWCGLRWGEPKPVVVTSSDWAFHLYPVLTATKGVAIGDVASVTAADTKFGFEPRDCRYLNVAGGDGRDEVRRVGEFVIDV
jgi:hypothetical protein